MVQDGGVWREKHESCYFGKKMKFLYKPCGLFCMDENGRYNYFIQDLNSLWACFEPTRMTTIGEDEKWKNHDLTKFNKKLPLSYGHNSLNFWN